MDDNKFAVARIEEDCINLTICDDKNILEFPNNQDKEKVPIFYNTDHAVIINRHVQIFGDAYIFDTIVDINKYMSINHLIYDLVQKVSEEKNLYAKK